MTKIEAARQEYEKWSSAIGITTAEEMNRFLADGFGVGLINLCEARQERKYAEVADQIFWSRDTRPIVMMSGPSSSGKTSSSLRIAQQCRTLGLFPHVIELDNYFVNRDDTPLDENGERDYECLGAMNIELLNSNLNDLLAGKEVVIPRFDFVKGVSVFEEDNKLLLKPNDVIFLEGIHALNPALTPAVDRSKIFSVYIAPLTALKLGTVEHGSTTDKRLLRRILRDSRTRGISPEENILRWPSVRRGEIKNIFPFEDNANVVFNSSLLYDLPMLKYFTEPMLYSIKESSPAYEKAQSLLKYTSKFTALKPSEIAAVPPTSIMREFIGGQMLF